MLQNAMIRRFMEISFLAALVGWGPSVRADDFAGTTQRIPMRFTPKLSASVPMNLVFQNEEGHPVELGKLFQQKPVILNLVYFNCPMMCTEVLNGLVQSMKKMTLQLGRDYNVITLSIDVREKPPLAKTKKKLYSDRYQRAGTDSGWSFLTGEAAAIQSLADAVGFQYRYYADIDQYDHALGIMILTPEGQVSRYFYGDRYDPKELRSALMEASRR